METWEYGKLVVYNVGFVENHQDDLPLPCVAKVITEHGEEIRILSNYFAVMNSLGAEGWIIDPGSGVQSGASPNLRRALEAHQPPLNLKYPQHTGHNIRRRL